jgi:ubiquinone/menaquinone biosynthesis C-methylase UbiE
MPNQYELTANYYDLDPRVIKSDDMKFYLDLARKINGNILEIACGTGRISLTLAKEGFNVWAFDLSPRMLEQMKKKVEALPQNVRERINLTRADMCNFELNKIFDLIIIPFRSFQAMWEDDQAISCLNQVYKHLADNGKFVINTFRPKTKLDETWICLDEQLHWEAIDISTGNNIKRFHIAKAIDTAKQIIYPEYIYYIEKPDKTTDKIIESLKLKYYYEEQLKELLKSSGFRIVKEMGYYDQTPVNQGTEFIFICKKNF